MKLYNYILINKCKFKLFGLYLYFKKIFKEILTLTMLNNKFYLRFIYTLNKVVNDKFSRCFKAFLFICQIDVCDQKI